MWGFISWLVAVGVRGMRGRLFFWGAFFVDLLAFFVLFFFSWLCMATGVGYAVLFFLCATVCLSVGAMKVALGVC